MDVLTILKTYGWSGLIILGGLYILYKLIMEGIKLLIAAAKSKILSKREIKLKQHAIFNAVNYSLNVEIPSMTLFANKPIRQTLMKDLVYCSVASVHEIVTVIANADQSDWNHSKWNYEMRAALTEMNTDFINKCEEKGIPEIVYKKYLVWYFFRLNTMRMVIDQIAGTETYTTAEAKTSALFLALHLFLVLFITDTESTLKELNGEITGILYRGSPIEPLADTYHN